MMRSLLPQCTSSWKSTLESSFWRHESGARSRPGRRRSASDGRRGALRALGGGRPPLPSLRVPSSPTLGAARCRAPRRRERAAGAAGAELEAMRARQPRPWRRPLELDPWREYDPLRAGIDRTTLRRFFRKRPQAIGRRFTTVARTLTAAPPAQVGARGAGRRRGRKTPSSTRRGRARRRSGSRRGAAVRAAVVARPAEHQGGADALAAARPCGRRGSDGAEAAADGEHAVRRRVAWAVSRRTSASARSRPASASTRPTRPTRRRSLRRSARRPSPSRRWARCTRRRCTTASRWR